MPPSPYTTPSYLTVPLPASPRRGRGRHGSRVRPRRPQLGLAPGGAAGSRCWAAPRCWAPWAWAPTWPGPRRRARSAARWLRRPFFPRSGRFPAGPGPRPGRSPARHDDAAPGPGLAPSATLVSLSSVSDCNSTRSLLRSRQRRGCAGLRPPRRPPTPAPAQRNPLWVDLELELRRTPGSRSTPTHVTAAARWPRGHRAGAARIGRWASGGRPEPRAPALSE